MNALSIVTTMVESLGTAGEDAEYWPAVSQALSYFGKRAGWGAETLNALQDASNVEQFLEKLTVNIVGGDIGAATAVAFAACLSDYEFGSALLTGVAFFSPDLALGIAGTIAGLPEIATVAAFGALIAIGSVGGSYVAEQLFNQASASLAAALVNPLTSDSGWFQIGSDSAGNSLLLDAVFNNVIGAALGLGNSSTLIIDMALDATSASNVASTGDTAETSLVNDANRLGDLVQAGALTGPLAGSSAVEGLCEILVQFAGDQEATIRADNGFDFNVNPNGAFANSSSSVLRIDLNPADWTQIYAQAAPDIVGEKDLLDAVASNLLGSTADAGRSILSELACN